MQPELIQRGNWRCAREIACMSQVPCFIAYDENWLTQEEHEGKVDEEQPAIGKEMEQPVVFDRNSVKHGGEFTRF